MTTERNIYVGPILVVDRTRLYKPITRQVCSICKGEIESKFCPDDGGSAEFVTRDEPVFFSLWDYINESDGLDNKFQVLADQPEKIGLRGTDPIKSCLNLDFDSDTSNAVFELPVEKINEKEFREIIDVLKKNNIKYKLIYGLKLWYS